MIQPAFRLNPKRARWSSIAKSLVLCSLHVTIAGISMAAMAAPAEYNPAYAPKPLGDTDSARVIVKFKNSANTVRMHALSSGASASETATALESRTKSLGLRVGRSLSAGRALDERTQVVRASGMSSKALAFRLSQDADVEYAEVDHRRRRFALPNDPLYAQGPAVVDGTGGPIVGQWYLREPKGEVASSINAPVAWDVSTGATDIVVAVLDTGVRGEHPELVGRLLPGYNMVSDVLASNDGIGRSANPADPGDWVTSEEANDRLGPFFQCDVSDSSWHGTATASLIGAATHNGAGMAGVAWGPKILPVRVLGKCSGSDSDILAGMRWAAGLSVPGVPTNPNPARILNMSLGGEGSCSRGYIDVINAMANRSQPTIVVAAAGNTTGQAVNTPANCPGVIGVAGLRHIGTKVGFSDLGPEISISAPGGNCVNIERGSPCLYPIITAGNTGTKGPVASNYSDSFAISVGTSFSSPLVAGTVALMLSVQPNLTPTEIKSLLQKSARPFPNPPSGSTTPICGTPDGSDQLECHCTTTTCGAGMLDATAALNAVLAAYPPANLTLSFASGWNMVGNGSASPLTVASFFADTAKVESVWSWNAAAGRWAFYTPALQGQALTDYLASRGYDRLTTIEVGSGFWVKAKQSFQTNVVHGRAVAASVVTGALRRGWNLVSSPQATDAMLFNASLSTAPAPAGTVADNYTSLWAWDTAKSQWYFYSPSLDRQGGTALKDFIDSHGYLDFTTYGKSLTPVQGFWVNKP